MSRWILRSAATLLTLVLLGPLAPVAPAARAADSDQPPHDQAATPTTLTGTVVDGETGTRLAGVRVRLAGVPAADVREAATDASGGFTLTRLPGTKGTLEASRLGYAPATVPYDLAFSLSIVIRLTPRAVPLAGVEVTTTRATARSSAVAFTELDRKQIDDRYWAQDIPMLLAETPGVYAYSDAGNGVGYSYVKIRGFSQRRVAVTIDGIPLNDPESHEVYWVDHPDLLASATEVQVQRGVGSALYGASAVGGSINLEVLGIPTERAIDLETGIGTYDTRRFALQYRSGILDDRYAVSGRYSRILSDGYREQSWSDLWSYAFSAARLDPWMTTRVNLYGGPERLHLAYYAVDRSYLDGRITGDATQDRRYNPLDWKNETDNFFEPHYELVNDVKLSDRASLTSAAFYFPGSGYYDDFPYGPIAFASTHLPNFYVDSDSLYPASYYEPDSLGNPALQPNGRYLVTGSDMTQRLWVRDRHYGWVPRARIRHDKGELTFGGEWREHTGRHWGEMTWAAAPPPGTTPNAVLYDYTGRVNVLSGFAQEAYDLRPNVKATGSLQWRHTRYAIGRDRYNGYDFHLDYSFLNPRLGVNWNVNDRWNAFASFAHTRTEPILSEIYHPDDPTSVPLFGKLDPANHVYEDPLIDPEKLNDWEAGIGYTATAAHAKVTAFLLDFSNEIVPSGQVDRFGVPITGNAARSKHEGIEAEFAARHRSGIDVSGNLTLSRNRFDDYREYVDATTYNDYGGNTIAGFPDRMANLTVGYSTRGVRGAVSVVETGRQYLDNTQDNRKDPALRAMPGYQHLYVEEHAVLNGTLTFDITRLAGVALLGEKRLSLDVRGMNLTGLRYETAGYVYAGVPYFYPASTRSVFVSLKAEF
ncbi:MAG: TonB-dependent receptor [Hyphomicrobiales bacterium]